MAISFNQFVGMGYLGADPEIRKLDRGGDVANFSVGITERWGGSGRDAQEHTEWMRCVCFTEQLVDVIDKYLKKGDPVHFQGKLRTRKYQDRDGEDKYITECVVFSVQLLGQRDDAGRGAGGRDDRSRDRDRGGRDDRGRGRDDRRDDRGGDRRAAGGRDDRGGDRGRDRGNGRDDRDDRGRGASGGGGYAPAGRGTQADRDLDDEIPF